MNINKRGAYLNKEQADSKPQNKNQRLIACKLKTLSLLLVVFIKAAFVFIKETFFFTKAAFLLKSL